VRSPYRVPEAAALAELPLPLGSGEPRARVAFAILQLGFAGATVGAVASTLGHALVGAGILGATGIASVLRWRRRQGRAVLRVTAGELVLTEGSDERLRVRLLDLEDVSLDTKSIRKVEPGQTSALHLTSSVGPEIDVGRIVFHVDGRPPLHLTDAFLPHSEVVEWTGRIRSFLRAQGWTPADENRDD